MGTQQTVWGWAVLLGVLLPLSVPGPIHAEPAGPTLDPRRVDWHTDYNLALQEAALTRRPLLVTFSTTWCGWCRKLNGSTFQDPAFVEISRHLVPVRLDGDAERGMVSLYRVTGYPTTLVVDRTGREVGRINGYLPANRFVPQIQNALSRREPYAEVRAEAKAHPDDPERQYALADVLLAVGEYREAREVLSRVAALSATEPGLAADVQLDRAISFLFNGEFEGAVPEFETYLSRHPEGERRDEALFFLGVALVRADRAGEGVPRLHEAAALTEMEYIKFEVERLVNMIQETEARSPRG